MAWTLAHSGTQTAVISTEHTLSTETGNATFILEVDTAAMVVGDVLELRAYGKTLTGGTEHLRYTATYIHVQSDQIKQSLPVPSDISTKFTLKQTAGTGRAFPWKVLSQ